MKIRNLSQVHSGRAMPIFTQIGNEKIPSVFLSWKESVDIIGHWFVLQLNSGNIELSLAGCNTFSDKSVLPPLVSQPWKRA